MYREDYYHEYLGGALGESMTQSAFANYRPDASSILQQSANYAFNDISLKHIWNLAKVTADPGKKLTQEEYNDSQYKRKEIKWEEGITQTQVEVLAETIDRDNFYAGYMRNADALSVASITGMILGSIPDPINYIPFAGWMTKLGKIGGIASKIPMLRMSADAMTGQTMFEAIKQGSYAKMGKDIDMQAALIDVGVAGLIGAGFGSIAMANKLRKLPSEVKNMHMSKTLTNIGNGDPVDIGNVHTQESLINGKPDIENTAPRVDEVGVTDDILFDVDNKLKETDIIFKESDDAQGTNLSDKTKEDIDSVLSDVQNCKG
tara:strand:- start:1218 stop:2171 length:954 start_codon:yes stop_codon:yes gene_type:complete